MMEPKIPVQFSANCSSNLTQVSFFLRGTLGGVTTDRNLSYPIYGGASGTRTPDPLLAKQVL